jgi:hypothetical protein
MSHYLIVLLSPAFRLLYALLRNPDPSFAEIALPCGAHFGARRSWPRPLRLRAAPLDDDDRA